MAEAHRLFSCPFAGDGGRVLPAAALHGILDSIPGKPSVRSLRRALSPLLSDRAAGLAIAAVTLTLLPGCSPGYVLRAGWEEAKLLDRRRPIREALRDTTTSPALRNKLRLVLDARDYAERSLGLDADDAFTSYATVPRDTLLLVVSAAPRFRLAWKTWWFPIVGSVPYKGFFDFEEARETADRLGKQGYDVYVRPSAAFSTLGWLPDPVLSTTLRGDSVAIVETVLHELTHTTWFPRGYADFSESFATFVGHAGAVAFFCRALESVPHCDTARNRWHDTRVFGNFLVALRDRLATLYESDRGPEAMAAAKRKILAEEAGRYRREVAPRFRAYSAGQLDPERLNNAWLLSRVLYYRRLDDFETIRQREGGVGDAARAVLEAGRSAASPWDGVDRLLTEDGG